jgi:hypothetical protein
MSASIAPIKNLNLPSIPSVQAVQELPVTDLEKDRLLAKLQLETAVYQDELASKKAKVETPKVAPIPTPNGVWVTDANQADLIAKTQKYIDKYFATTPITAKQLVELAKVNKFPLDFLILNGHLESHFCTKGRGATSNNCHNVNNTDAGDYKPTVCGQFTECHSDILQGEQKFINLIKNCYIGDNQELSLQTFIDNDFRIQKTVEPFCSAKVGSRYMTDKNSRNKYIFGIQNWINTIF